MSLALETFVRTSSRYLGEIHLPRLEQALEVLPQEDLWWRPHPGVISVGNILMHLEGNVRQWIIAGIGDRPDYRNRAGEFSAEDGPTARALMDRLRATVSEACSVIDALQIEQLDSQRSIQGKATSVVEAVYHVVEHFSWHTGQVVWIAKLRAGAGHGIAFYDDAAINEARNG